MPDEGGPADDTREEEEGREEPENLARKDRKDFPNDTLRNHSGQKATGNLRAKKNETRRGFFLRHLKIPWHLARRRGKLAGDEEGGGGMAEHDGEHSLRYDGERSPVMTEQPPGPDSWADFLFWMVSGFLIGGLIPTAACAFLPPGEAIRECFPIALKVVPLAAILGGLVGMSYGWTRPRCPPL
jgi:hypothetical protein